MPFCPSYHVRTSIAEGHTANYRTATVSPCGTPWNALSVLHFVFVGFLLFLHRPTALELIAVGSNVTLKRENVCVCIYRDAVDKSRCSGVAYPFTHLFVRCTLYFLSSTGFLGELLALLRFGICAR